MGEGRDEIVYQLEIGVGWDGTGARGTLHHRPRARGGGSICTSGAFSRDSLAARPSGFTAFPKNNTKRGTSSSAGDQHTAAAVREPTEKICSIGEGMKPRGSFATDIRAAPQVEGGGNVGRHGGCGTFARAK